MIFPLPPIKTRFLQKDGTVHPNWINYFSNLHLQVSGNLADDGYVLPSITNTTEQNTVDVLQKDRLKKHQPRILHNKTDGKYYVNILPTNQSDDSEYKAIQLESNP